VQKQESFDFRGSEPAKPAIITEQGIKFRADPAGAHKTGFFADQRDNREWLSHLCAGQRVLDLCCNTGGFAVYAAARGASEVIGIDIDNDVLDIAKGNAETERRAPALRAGRYLPVAARCLEQRRALRRGDPRPAKMTRDPRAGDPRAQEIPRHEQARP
jgi:23S rRNA (cytosine1962-C5)-methyltransferase